MGLKNKFAPKRFLGDLAKKIVRNKVKTEINHRWEFVENLFKVRRRFKKRKSRLFKIKKKEKQ